MTNHEIDWISVAVFVLMALLALSAFADIIPIGGNEIIYLVCDVCGREVPSELVVTFAPPRGRWDGKVRPEHVESMKPYTKKSYRICFRCIFEALKIKPEETNESIIKKND